MDHWTRRESSCSGGSGGNCLEAAGTTATGAAVRDTQNRHLGHLEADHRERIALLEVVKGPTPDPLTPSKHPCSQHPKDAPSPPPGHPGRGLAWKDHRLYRVGRYLCSSYGVTWRR
ncbi:DUF397 domain-containing protein [Nocardiopsis dassonvillei]|uniref:DUF397 domain-containing protein n=1 Tax=Nocardiopsis dassonvillei TaxID=2014 RepID=UPI0027E2F8B6|nr:DUF397 domain-containing protein [Nocardiopsis dassonvillei]